MPTQPSPTSLRAAPLRRGLRLSAPLALAVGAFCCLLFAIRPAATQAASNVAQQRAVVATTVISDTKLPDASSNVAPDGTGQQPPAPIIAAPYPSFLESIALNLQADTTSVAIGDLDGDGDFDLVMGNKGTITTPVANAIFLNTLNFRQTPSPKGFQPSAPTFFGLPNAVTATVAVGDMDGDGLLDIVAGLYGGPNVVYLNDPTQPGNFTTRPTVTVGLAGEKTTSLAIGDLDGDRRYDLVVGNHGTSRVYFNQAAGTAISFAFSTTLALSSTTSSVAIGDLGGNPLLDIVMGNQGAANCVFYQQAPGQFAACEPFGSAEGATTGIALANLRGSDTLDIAEAIYQDVSQIYESYLAEGETAFSQTPLPNTLGLIRTKALAVGDMNGDGRVDIVTGNYDQANALYFNLGPVALGDPPLARALLDRNKPEDGVTVSAKTRTRAIAVADLNNDGALDIVVGNNNSEAAAQAAGPQFSRIYFSNGAGHYPSSQPVAAGAPEQGATLFDDVIPFVGNATWVDANADHYLDLVTSNQMSGTQELFLFSPTMRALISQPIAVGSSGYNLNGAWGDIDNDHDLDLVNSFSLDQQAEQQVRLYVNNTAADGIPQLAAQPFMQIAPPQSTEVLTGGMPVFGDVNHDQRTDVAIVSWDAPSIIQVSQPGGDQYTYATIELIDQSLPISAALASQAAAFGDMNNDGALDLVVINAGLVNQIFMNDGDGNFPADQVRYFGEQSDLDGQVALGDLDGDGWLDIVVGLHDQPSKIYHNDQRGAFPEGRVERFGSSSTEALAVLDIDGDGDLDIAIADSNQGSAVYINQGFPSIPFQTARVLGQGDATAYSIDPGDSDNNGTLDLAIAAGENGAAIYHNYSRIARNLPMPPLWITVTRPVSTPAAAFFSSAQVVTADAIPVAYQISGPPDSEASAVRVAFSLNGGGQWYGAVATNTITTNVPVNTPQIFTWDTYASRLMGQADNLVLRIEAYPVIKPITNGIPGPYLWPYAAATTYPFRVRGTLPRIVKADGSGAAPVVGARLYRLANNATIATRYEDPAAQAFRSNTDGYLRAPGIFSADEQWVALLPYDNPIDRRTAYTTMLTSETVTDITNLQMHKITTPGVHTLTVSTTNPLMLFDLAIALEWQPVDETSYRLQLEKDLQRVSEYLYDWSNGQVALGNITIYRDDTARWAPRYTAADQPLDWSKTADIQIYASNRIRPNADVGGNLQHTAPVPLTPPLRLPNQTEKAAVHYNPGQVRIGITWNRYGDRDGDIGEDWGLALAHELGHYLLRLQDNYLGLDEHKRLVTFTTCPGAMTNPYSTDPKYSEFLASQTLTDTYAERCGGDGNEQKIIGTISQFVTGWDDWETITRTFSLLQFKPTEGPDDLPLAVTRISYPPSANTTTAALLTKNRFVFTTGEANGDHVSANARVYLMRYNGAEQMPTQIIDLGNPQFDQIIAHGARVGDLVCIYDLGMAQPLHGCSGRIVQERAAPIEATTVSLTPKAAAWPPDVHVQPGPTLTLTTRYTPTDELWARLYPINITYAQTTTAIYTLTTRFIPLGNGEFQGVIALPPLQRAVAGYIVIWDGPNPDPFANARHFVIDYTLGGSPCCHHLGDRTLKVSPDGEVIFYALSYTNTEQAFFSLQTLNRIPNPPQWAKPVGQVYELRISKGVTPTILADSSASLLFNYLERHVVPGEEAHLRLYYAPPLSVTAPTAVTWTPLDTYLNPEFNTASALAPKPGIYALMASMALPLHQGWNLIGYPNVEAQPVISALQSITNSYTYILGHDAAAGKWQVYPHAGLTTTTTLTQLKALTELTFGTGYWLHVTEPITLYLRSSERNSPYTPERPIAAVLSLPRPDFAVITGTLPQTLSITSGEQISASASLTGTSAGQPCVYPVRLKFSPKRLPIFAALVPLTATGAIACSNATTIAIMVEETKIYEGPLPNR